MNWNDLSNFPYVCRHSYQTTRFSRLDRDGTESGKATSTKGDVALMTRGTGHKRQTRTPRRSGKRYLRSQKGARSRGNESACGREPETRCQAYSTARRRKSKSRRPMALGPG